MKVAESNRDVVESRLRQETMNFNQDIFILVERFNRKTLMNFNNTTGTADYFFVTLLPDHSLDIGVNAFSRTEIP